MNRQAGCQLSELLRSSTSRAKSILAPAACRRPALWVAGACAQPAFQPPLALPAVKSPLAAHAAAQCGGACRQPARRPPAAAATSCIPTTKARAGRRPRCPSAPTCSRCTFRAPAKAGPSDTKASCCIPPTAAHVEQAARRPHDRRADARHYEQRAKAGDAKAADMLREAEAFAAQGPDKPFLDVWFENEQKGFVVGAFNLILRTEDGGQSWTPWLDRVDNPKAYHLYSIRPAAGTLFIVGEQGLVLKLDADAQRFASVALPYAGTLVRRARRPRRSGRVRHARQCLPQHRRRRELAEARHRRQLGPGSRRAARATAPRAGEPGRASCCWAAPTADSRKIELDAPMPAFAVAEAGAGRVAIARGRAACASIAEVNPRLPTPDHDDPSRSTPCRRSATLKDFDRTPATASSASSSTTACSSCVACVLTTLLLGWQATPLMLNAAFEKTIPHHQPYIQNFLAQREDLKGLGNAVRVVVENKSGDIFDPDYLAGAQADQRRALPHARRGPRRA